MEDYWEKTIKVALGNEREKKRSSQFNSDISGKPSSGFLCFSELKHLNAIIHVITITKILIMYARV